MTEREQRAFLSRPIPREITHPEHLVRPTRIRILRPFMVRGQRAEVGDVVEIPFADARDAVALKRAEYVA